MRQSTSTIRASSNTNNQVSVFGLRVNNFTKSQLIQKLSSSIIAGQSKIFLTTVYSEFLYRGLKSKDEMSLLNSATYAVPDGVGVIWAEYFQRQHLTAKSIIGKVLQATWQMAWTGASILLSPKKLYQVFPQKIVGADLIYDLAEMASQSGLSIFLAGWPGQDTKKAADILKQKFPNLKIAGTIDADLYQESNQIISAIKNAKPDLLFAGFGPIKQEKFISENLDLLPVKFAVGLGGTFDYMLGKTIEPPKFVRRFGLEWLFRLFTQPSRVYRIFQSTIGLILLLIKAKVVETFPYRQNVCCVVINHKKEVAIFKRRVDEYMAHHKPLVANNYWQFPQGGVDEGEDLISAAKRELFEETRIKSTKILGQAIYINTYKWVLDIPKIFVPKFRRHKGQSQTTIFFEFFGDESEIKLDNRELVEYKFVSIEEARNLLAEDRQLHAQKVLQELKNIIDTQHDNTK